MTWVMATDSAAATGCRAGITFDVEPLWFGSYKDEMCGVCVPWFRIRGCWSGVFMM